MKIEDIEKAISELAPADLDRLRRWFEELDAQLLDQRIERDVASGKLDKILAEVEANHKAGRRRDL